MEYIESTIYQVMFMYHNPMNCFMEYRYKLAALANTYFMNDLPCQRHRLPYTHQFKSHGRGVSPRLKFLVRYYDATLSVWLCEAMPVSHFFQRLLIYYLCILCQPPTVHLEGCSGEDAISKTTKQFIHLHDVSHYKRFLWSYILVTSKFYAFGRRNNTNTYPFWEVYKERKSVKFVWVGQFRATQGLVLLTFPNNI
jgi:hypothetical protein